MDQKSRHVVIGTAGHIDHGKTALVKNLTGKDTDWLKEEKERGMTIDLGFAFMGDDVTIIDVPGHEKFVRNMVAGVSTIDLVLLVIAADDGVMPQTREHLDIVNLLKIPKGIVVLTKTDLVETEWVDLVKDEVQNLLKGTVLQNAPIMRVSNANGDGIDALRSVIADHIAQVEKRHDKGIFRLPIDRIFTMKGFGTVVAGTVLSGQLSQDQNVELLPHQKKLRVRNIQMHDRNVKQVTTGDRAAINLAGIEKTTIHRGDVLAAPDFYKPTKFMDADLYLLKSSPRKLKNRSRIRLNVGTSEIIGRVTVLDKDEVLPGENAYIQLRLEKPVVADAEDRFVLRSYSPVITIGGGRILDVHPRRHKRFSEKILNRLKNLEKGDPAILAEQFFLKKSFALYTKQAVSQGASISMGELDAILDSLISGNRLISIAEKGQEYYIHSSYYNSVCERILTALNDYHSKNPTKNGMNRSDVKGFLDTQLEPFFINRIIEDLSQQERIRLFDGKIALFDHKSEISVDLRQLMNDVANRFLEAEFATPGIKEIAETMRIDGASVGQAVDLLLDSRQIVKIEKNIFMHNQSMEKAEKRIIEHFQNHETLTVGECGKFLNTSRKYSVPLLNYYDQRGLTTRQGDVRVMNAEYLSKS
jgi:selenocysteine-specific elongation factor